MATEDDDANMIVADDLCYRPTLSHPIWTLDKEVAEKQAVQETAGKGRALAFMAGKAWLLRTQDQGEHPKKPLVLQVTGTSNTPVNVEFTTRPLAWRLSPRITYAAVGTIKTAENKYLYEVLGFTAENYEEKLRQAKRWVFNLKQAQQSQGTAPTSALSDDSLRVQMNSSTTCTPVEVDMEDVQADSKRRKLTNGTAIGSQLGAPTPWQTEATRDAFGADHTPGTQGLESADMEVDKEGEQAAGAVHTPVGDAGDANASTATAGPVTSPSGVTHAQHSLFTPTVPEPYGMVLEKIQDEEDEGPDAANAEFAPESKAEDKEQDAEVQGDEQDEDVDVEEEEAEEEEGVQEEEQEEEVEVEAEEGEEEDEVQEEGQEEEEDGEEKVEEEKDEVEEEEEEEDVQEEEEDATNPKASATTLPVVPSLKRYTRSSAAKLVAASKPAAGLYKHTTKGQRAAAAAVLVKGQRAAKPAVTKQQTVTAALKVDSDSVKVPVPGKYAGSRMEAAAGKLPDARKLTSLSDPVPLEEVGSRVQLVGFAVSREVAVQKAVDHTDTNAKELGQFFTPVFTVFQAAAGQAASEQEARGQAAEAAGQTASGQESAEKESTRQAAAGQAAPKQARAGQKAAGKTAAEKAAARQMVVEQEAAEKEAAVQAAAGQEVSEKAAGQAAAEQVAAEKEAAGQETAGQTAVEKEAPWQVAAEKEATRQAAAEKEAAEKEVAGQAAPGQEAAEKEAAEKEVAGQAVAGQEAAEKEAAEKEVAGQAVAGQEAAEKEAAEKEVAGQAAAGQEAAEKEAAGQEAAVLKADEDDLVSVSAGEQRLMRTAVLGGKVRSWVNK